MQSLGHIHHKVIKGYDKHISMAIIKNNQYYAKYKLNLLKMGCQKENISPIQGASSHMTIHPNPGSDFL